VLDKLQGLKDAGILISGGTGFFGSWISEAISYLNDVHHFEIRLYLVARDRHLLDSRLSHIRGKPYVQFVRCDVRSIAEVPKDVNYVIHAAANPDFRFHSSNPIETMTTIAQGTESILRAVDRVSDLRMFLNVSSSSVYGAPFETEEGIAEAGKGLALADIGKHPYAEAKRYAESLCFAAHAAARIPLVTVRPFTFLGAYQSLDAPWAINNFMRDALSKRAIRILGDGQTIRSFMHGTDLSAWLLVILLRSKSGQTYNVGSGSGMALLDAARKVASNVEPVPDVVTNASLTGAVTNTYLVPDVSAAMRDFGLRQYTPFDVAVKRTMDWFVGQSEEDRIR